MTTLEKIEAIQEACIEANSEIKGLKPGCVLIVGKKKYRLTLTCPIEGGYCGECRKGQIAGSGFTPYKCGYCKKGFSHSNTNVPKYCTVCADKYAKCRWCATPLKILGRPIRLADVLLALPRMKELERASVIGFDYSNPSIVLIMDGKHTHPRAEWNLRADDLTLQEPATIDFIYSVLKK